jgi:hypothetical protein
MKTYRRCERWSEIGRCGDVADWQTESGHWFCGEHTSQALREDVEPCADTERAPAVAVSQ